MDKNYKIVDSISITDWFTKLDLLSLDNNFDELLNGLLETASGRISRPSYNFYVTAERLLHYYELHVKFIHIYIDTNFVHF